MLSRELDDDMSLAEFTVCLYSARSKTRPCRKQSNRAHRRICHFSAVLVPENHSQPPLPRIERFQTSDRHPAVNAPAAIAKMKRLTVTAIAALCNGLTVTMDSDISINTVVAGYDSNGHMIQNAGHLASHRLQMGIWSADASSGTFLSNQ